MKTKELIILTTDPFQGDFGTSDDRVLSNKIVTAKKSKTPCSLCNKKTISGTRVRVMTAKYDGVIMSYRFCEECCDSFIDEKY